jgi:lipid-A-disaccharide synthase
MWRHGLLSLRRSLGVATEWRFPAGQRCPRFAAPMSNVASDAEDDDEEFRVFIVAGEPSGDVIGSRLMGSLRRLSPKPLRFAGVGG